MCSLTPTMTTAASATAPAPVTTTAPAKMITTSRATIATAAASATTPASPATVLMAALVATLLLTTPSIHAQEESALTVEEVISRAVTESDAIEDAREQVQEALEALSPGFDVDSIRLSISGSSRYTRPPDEPHTQQPEPAGPIDGSMRASINVPIIPQISFGADVSTDFSSIDSSYSVSASPFAPGRVTYRERKAYEQASLNLISQTASLPYRIESAVYRLLLAEWSRSLAERALDLEESRFAISEEQYRIGDISHSAYNKAQDALASSRRSLYEAERSELAARRSLVEMLGVELGTVEVQRPEIEAVEAEIERRAAGLERELDAAITSALLSARIELRALKGQLDETPLFDPTLSVSANTSVPFSSVSVSASLTLSADQYRREEREDIERAIADQEEAVRVAELSKQFEIDMLSRQLESAIRLYESSVSTEESAETAFEETLYYFEAGERTDLELEEAKLSLESSRRNRYQSAVALLEAYGSLLELVELGKE